MLTKPLFQNPSLPLAVVMAATQWDEPPRMRHQVTNQLVRWFNVLFVEFLPGERTENSSGAIRPCGDRLVVWRSTTKFRVPARLYANIPVVHALANRWYREQILRAVIQLRLSPVLLFNFVHDFHEIMEPKIFSYKAYFCFDEFPRMWRGARKPNALKFLYQSRLFQYYENRVAKLATRCFASHTPLVEKLIRVNRKTSLLLHAHEFSSAPSARPSRKDPRRIRVAYMGHITYNLLSDWLHAVLTSSDTDLFLIGPILKFNPDRFLRYNNFHHIPPLTDNALLETLASMDVLVMPYDCEIPEVSVQTVSNKFFKYLAAGRPVVISDMRYYISMPKGVIYRAHSAQDFVSKIRQAHLEDCEEFVQLRLRIAAENTWQRRGDRLREIIDQDMGASSPFPLLCTPLA